jgi:hypothetical protein
MPECPVSLSAAFCREKLTQPFQRVQNWNMAGAVLGYGKNAQVFALATACATLRTTLGPTFRPCPNLRASRAPLDRERVARRHAWRAARGPNPGAIRHAYRPNSRTGRARCRRSRARDTAYTRPTRTGAPPTGMASPGRPQSPPRLRPPRRLALRPRQFPPGARALRSARRLWPGLVGRALARGGPVVLQGP